MGIKKRSLKETLIQVAVRLIEERGYPDISLREIAEAAKVSHPAVYRHFPSKNGVFAEIGRLGFEALGKSLHAISVADMNKSGRRDFRDSRDSRDSKERLLAMGLAYVDYAISNPAYFRCMFLAALQPRDEFPEFRYAAKATYLMLVEAAENYLTAHVPSVADSEILDLTDSVWALVHGVSILCLDRQFENPEFPNGRSAQKLAEAALLRLLSHEPA